jgi:OmpA-OmpF porin, OOP family
MKTKLVARIAAAILTCSAGIPLAHADDASGWYAGANLSRTDAKTGDDLDHVFANQGLTTSSSLDRHADAYSLDLGYQVNSNFAVEGSYVDLGKHNFTSSVSAPAADTMSGDLKPRDYGVSAVGILPIDAGWAAYGKAGLLRVKTDLDASSTGAVAVSGASQDNTSATYGLGVSYDFTKAVAGKLEWNRYQDVGDREVTGQSNINLVSGGVAFQF